MPYIKEYNKEKFHLMLSKLQEERIVNAGELNYLFTRIINEYLVQNNLNYQHINDCIGALEGAKLELYRRVAGNYEDKKIQENGDVYSTSLTKGKGK